MAVSNKTRFAFKGFRAPSQAQSLRSNLVADPLPAEPEIVGIIAPEAAGQPASGTAQALDIADGSSSKKGRQPTARRGRKRSAAAMTQESVDAGQRQADDHEVRDDEGLDALDLFSVAKWNLNQLESDRLNAVCLFWASLPCPGQLRVGTACSGTDSPLIALQYLAQGAREVLGIEAEVRHCFSCELDPQKRTFITDHFPDLEALYEDVNTLGDALTINLLTGEKEKPREVDLFVAGFVCKSVSTENTERKQHGQCIAQQTGQTGETFRGLGLPFCGSDLFNQNVKKL